MICHVSDERVGGVPVDQADRTDGMAKGCIGCTSDRIG